MKIRSLTPFYRNWTLLPSWIENYKMGFYCWLFRVVFEVNHSPLRISITLDQQIPLRYNVTPGFKFTSFIMGNTPLWWTPRPRLRSSLILETCNECKKKSQHGRLQPNHHTRGEEIMATKLKWTRFPKADYVWPSCGFIIKYARSINKREIIHSTRPS